ncbi:MAG: hypothetical protein HY719_09040, partial [Planctomycetes bacterium]|nr:hypothetical protein [Planctomycetota bacterium]
MGTFSFFRKWKKQKSPPTGEPEPGDSAAPDETAPPRAEKVFSAREAAVDGDVIIDPSQNQVIEPPPTPIVRAPGAGGPASHGVPDGKGEGVGAAADLPSPFLDVPLVTDVIIPLPPGLGGDEEETVPRGERVADGQTPAEEGEVEAPRADSATADGDAGVGALGLAEEGAVIPSARDAFGRAVGAGPADEPHYEAADLDFADADPSPPLDLVEEGPTDPALTAGLAPGPPDAAGSPPFVFEPGGGWDFEPSPDAVATRAAPIPSAGEAVVDEAPSEPAEETARGAAPSEGGESAHAPVAAEARGDWVVDEYGGFPPPISEPETQEVGETGGGLYNPVIDPYGVVHEPEEALLPAPAMPMPAPGPEPPAPVAAGEQPAPVVTPGEETVAPPDLPAVEETPAHHEAPPEPEEERPPELPTEQPVASAAGEVTALVPPEPSALPAPRDRAPLGAPDGDGLLLRLAPPPEPEAAAPA